MRPCKAFSIIELLVLIAIIVILLAILLPAIGKARDAAYVSRSQSNLRQIAIAHATYAAEYNDEQWTNIPHDIAVYGNTLDIAFVKIAQTGRYTDSELITGTLWHTPLGIGQNPHGSGFKMYRHIGNDSAPPIAFTSNPFSNPYWGSFRLIQANSFNQYLSGRFYDPTFFAPKDRLIIDACSYCFDAPGEFCTLKPDVSYTNAGDSIWSSVRIITVWSSYVLSPAAMYNPEVFSRDSFTVSPFAKNNLWNIPAAFRSPTFSQARYPDLKTHMLEHHWLQGSPQPCNPTVTNTIIGCGEPYRFNGALDSAPATLFYDGHIRLLSQREVIDADSKAKASAGGDPHQGLWHTKTPLATGGGHYRHQWAYTSPGQPTFDPSSYHILTRHGILGRDTFAR